ncbi:DUF1822 family protein [Okeania sp. KiyG1]|uniref:DUF1822 family protein n=1 Tax=Okeania sp. KiyG1 TaxID=2720165 RepID=UPI0019210974|nr:DUF1822 family protein [Okeania sp. KiyG1]GGA12909.1 hypothetical protein CYANOKiyG1_26130 [Okeania sp. KiyG1]
MPTEKSRTFTDKHKEQVKRFLEALLDYQKYEKIEAEWQEGNPEPHHLVVNKTTKKDLAEKAYSDQDFYKNPQKYENELYQKEQRKYKSYIQTAMAYLEDLKILVRHSPKKGAAAKNLRFDLRLTSQNKQEIFQSIFEDKWKQKRENLSNNPSIIQEHSNIEVEQAVAGVEVKGEITIIKYMVKFKGDLDTIRQHQEKIRQAIMEISRDSRNKIVGTKEGCVIIEFEGSLEGFNRLESKIKSGELTEISGFPILEVQQIDELAFSDAADIGFKLTQWFDNIQINDWVYDIGIQASRLVKQLNNDMTVAVLKGNPAAEKNNLLDNIVSKIPPEWLSEMGLDSSQFSSNQILIRLLNSSNLDCIKFIAYELGDLTNFPGEIIDTLANRIPTITDSETSWQLALTLGKFQPENLLGAVGQTKTIEFPTDDWFDLFLALRVNEDDLIDVLIQVSSATDEYLPVGLQVCLLDETEEIFSKVEANEEKRYLSLEFTGGIDQFFSIKFSLGDSDMIENFVI